METLHTQILRDILVQYGRSVLEEPRRVKALLADYLGQHPGNHEQAINVLVLALENRVVQDLLVSDGLPPDMVQRRVAERFGNSLGLTEGTANWAIGTWVASLTPSVVMPVPVPVAAQANFAPQPLSTPVRPIPVAMPLSAAAGETEGPQASSRFHSVTQATAWPSSKGSQRKWLILVGGIAGVIPLIALFLFFKSSGSTPSSPATLASKQEPPSPPDTWKVIFRSADPSIWNDDVNRGPNHFAMALELVPDHIRYLKLTNTGDKDFVILEMNKQRLRQRSNDGRYGWDGLNQSNYGAHHLGVYYSIWNFFRNGDVAVCGGPHLRGWGFGHNNHEGQQRHCWAGKLIPPTVFEIAVKSEALTDEEARKLLKAGNPRESTGPRPAAAGSWQVIFRSSDPSLWNDDIQGGADRFGMALELVPDDIKYLRLTNAASKDFVIVEMTKQRLRQRNHVGYGWDGLNQFNYGAYHLGICYSIWNSFEQDDVAVCSGPHLRGWGFGHNGHEGQQRHSWAGKLVQPTVFEIAVKSEPLTEAETKKLLKAGNPR